MNECLVYNNHVAVHKHKQICITEHGFRQFYSVHLEAISAFDAPQIRRPMLFCNSSAEGRIQARRGAPGAEE